MNKVKTLLLLSLMFVSLAGLKTPTTVYVSKVPKNSINQFLNRFATSDAQIVVTKNAIAGALGYKKIVIDNNEPIYFFESQSPRSKNCRRRRG